jgi:xanthine dehydrogenase accessory factor
MLNDSLLPVCAHAYATACRDALRPACVVRITAVFGSVPRATDAALVVDADGFGGTIGGGHLELEAIRLARGKLADHGDRPASFPAEFPVDHRRFPLGPSLGQCCGGAVELRFSPLTDDDLPALAALEPPRRAVWLYGAGHVARAIVYALLPLPFEIHWVETRDEMLPDGPFPPHVVLHHTDDAAAEAMEAPAGACHLVMTHSHAIDFDIVQAVLARADAGYCGLIGSATKRTTFERRLAARGIPDDRIASLVCPIGIADLPGKRPEVIAVAVAAQLLGWSLHDR